MQPGYELAGRYVLERLLGQGAVGEVWRAADRDLDRPVAVKLIRERITDPKLAAGFQREARIAGRLQHPGITVVHDAGDSDGQPFIVMELLRGRDLDAVLAECPGGLPADQALSLAIQAADALTAAHAGGVIHRDLKPANLFLREDGQLKICDFGIAVAAGATASAASASYIVGTPAYMSPEQCDGQEAGERGDLYSLGCVLYALLAGRPPFTGRPPLAIMSQHRTAVPAAPRALRPAIPAGLDSLVMSLLAKDPADRPASASQVAAALRELRAAPARAIAGIPRPPDAAGQDSAAERPVAVDSQQLLATAGSDHTVRLWDPATGRQTATLEGHQRKINAACAITVSGKQLLATAGSDHTVRLWDPVTGQEAATLEGHQRKINAACAITVSGKQLLATAGSDHTVRLWDPVTGQEAATLEGHHHRTINAMCRITVDGRQLLATAGSDHTVRIWDPATGQTAVLRGHRGRVCTVCAVTIDGRPLVATGGSDGSVRLWDPATRQQAAEMRAHGDNWPHDRVMGICSVTVGGRPLLATGQEFGTVRLWDPARGDHIGVMLRDPDWPVGTPGSVIGICAVAIGGRPLLATGHFSGIVRVWDPATRRLTVSLRGHRSQVNAVCPITVTGGWKTKPGSR